MLKPVQLNNLKRSRTLRDRLQISLLTSMEFKRINRFLFPLTLSEIIWFSDDLRVNRS